MLIGETGFSLVLGVTSTLIAVLAIVVPIAFRRAEARRREIANLAERLARIEGKMEIAPVRSVPVLGPCTDQPK